MGIRLWLSCAGSAASALAYCERPNRASTCSAGIAPTTAIGCWPGRKNAIVGRVMIWSACETPGFASTSIFTTSIAPSYFSAIFSSSGRDHAARAAPGRPEVDDDRSLRVEDDLFEGLVRYCFDFGHLVMVLSTCRS